MEDFLSEMCGNSPTPGNYLSQNRATYNSLAAQYESRITSDVLNDLPLVFRFWQQLLQRFADDISLIDLGCGNGLNLAMFARLGAATTGLDVSEAMIEIAQKVSPSSRFFTREFLSCNEPLGLHHGVFAKAFFHLFPERDCGKLLHKMRSILLPEGIVYIATTVEDVSSEGYLEKKDYSGDSLRFRRRWSRQDLRSFLEKHDFRVIDEWENVEVARGKRWINLVAEKC